MPSMNSIQAQPFQMAFWTCPLSGPPIIFNMNEFVTSPSLGTRPVLPAWLGFDFSLSSPSISHQILLIQPSNYLPCLPFHSTPGDPLGQGPFSPKVLLRRTWRVC